MRIATIIGARPQFIKAAMVSHALDTQDGISEIIIHTGQHFDANMSEVFFEELGIPKPTYNLNIGGGSHGQNTGRMIEAIESVLLKQKPDCVLVYGDTDSTLAGALAAAKLHIPVAHVEAGLRSFNRRMPEEINRILTDHVSSLLFAPTQAAVQCLASEGISGNNVRLVGDVMFDAALHYSKRAQDRSKILSWLGLQPKTYTLATIHRAENTNDANRLNIILKSFSEFAQLIVLPLHPRTRDLVSKSGLVLPPNIRAIEPVSYLDMVMLEQNASLIATDSGGVQKEAFFHRVPCVTLRDETEWVELVNTGWNRLAPPVDTSAVVEKMHLALDSQGTDLQPYGTGNASVSIANDLITMFET